MSKEQFPSKPAELAVEPVRNQRWRFYVKIGQAGYWPEVEARDEATGYRVMVTYCEKHGYRPASKVFPVLVADESILKEPVLTTITGTIGNIAPSGITVNAPDHQPQSGRALVR